MPKSYHLIGSCTSVNSTALGHSTLLASSNTIRLGRISVSTIGGYANWSNVSDGRFKEDVQENVAGLEFIKKLRPITYRLDMDALAAFHNTPDRLRLPDSEKLKAAEVQVGFIAQEVETAARELNFNFHGVDVPKNETSHYGLRYAEFVVPLVKVMQELTGQVSEQEDQINEQLGQIESQQALVDNQKLINAQLLAQLSIQSTMLEQITQALAKAGIEYQ